MLYITTHLSKQNQNIKKWMNKYTNTFADLVLRESAMLKFIFSIVLFLKLPAKIKKNPFYIYMSTVFYYTYIF